MCRALGTAFPLQSLPALTGLTLLAACLNVAAAGATPRGASGAEALQDCNAPSHLRVLHAAAPLPEPWRHAQAVWLDQRHLRWPQAAMAPGSRLRLVAGNPGALSVAAGAPVRGALWSAVLSALPDGALPAASAARFPHLRGGAVLRLAERDGASLPQQLRRQMLLVQEDAQGRVQRATATQPAGALDSLYAAAEREVLGPFSSPTSSPASSPTSNPMAAPTPNPQGPHAAPHAPLQVAVWAPTAVAVQACLFGGPDTAAVAAQALHRDARTGVWRSGARAWKPGQVYSYLVDVFTPGHGLVRHRVTDPYSLALTADSQRSVAVDLAAPALQPPGWAGAPRPGRTLANTDLVIYELHVRDFSIGDASVPPPLRGTYAAFTATASHGMQHLRALATAGLTDVHLLPVFDIASVPERGCTSPNAAALAAAGPASETQQALVMAGAATDCFNWGYDPWHYTVPEGSYATDAADPARRILEFRRMVMALHAAGLRVGMDMVYNHTSASGDSTKSVLDRIVPGYYHRLNAEGVVERSTCCDNTATEHRMMAKLMIDSAVVWARDYGIDSMRFDLMGHQPRDAMLRLQAAVNATAGRHIHLIGEGWNFGEVKDGARFVQAAQGRLAGSGIATFNDRLRDALRGGGCCDGGDDVVARQGWLNGLHFAPNALAAARAPATTRDELLRTADLVRVGLAGTLADYRFTTFDGRERRAADIDYAGQPAGYASQPGEVVNYVENHDNPTLFDLNAMKLPRGHASGTSREDRARVQVLGLAAVMFSQGVPYFHAGIEALRSKSLDRNSFDSGDWFNRLDWTFSDNFFATGLPPKSENGAVWPLMKPALEDASIKPGAAEIRFTRDAFLDLLRMRASTSLFRLRSAAEVQRRLTLLNTGPNQAPTLVIGHLDGHDLPDAGFAELLYAINTGVQAETLKLAPLQGRAFELHPVQAAASAADARLARESRWDAASASLTVPARSAVVWVLPAAARAASR